MSAHFTLSDLEATSKKEVIRIDGSKLKFPKLRSPSKKRRIDEVYDLDDPPANLLTATELMIQNYLKKVEIIDDMRALAIDRIAAHEKDSVKLAKAKRKIKDLKASISKKLTKAKDEVMVMKDVLIDEMKRDAAIAVLESRILMATKAADNGFDTSLWNVQAWKDKLADIKGNDPDIETTPTGTSNRAFKAPKRKSTKAPKPNFNNTLLMLGDEVLDSGDNEDTIMAGDTADSDGTLGEDGM